MNSSAIERIAFAVIVGMTLVSSSGCASTAADVDAAPAVGQATSSVLSTDAGELVLLQAVTFAASAEDVWRAYTTADGWTAWASPKAEIDLRVGGTIRTAYAGEIGGAGTNTLHILNYVPHKVLTLKSDLSRNWPEIMQQDADKLSNVILFDEVSPGVTRITSYGIGYSDAPEYEELMKFFIRANESLYQNLRAYLETGIRTEWGR